MPLGGSQEPSPSFDDDSLDEAPAPLADAAPSHEEPPAEEFDVSNASADLTVLPHDEGESFGRDEGMVPYPTQQIADAVAEDIAEAIAAEEGLLEGATHEEFAIDIGPADVADVAPTVPLREGDLWQTLDAVADPLYVVDRQWRFRFVNRAAAEGWQLGRDALVGRSMWSMYPQAVGSEPYQRLASAMRERRPVTVEMFSPALRSRVETAAYPLGDGLVIYQRDVDQLEAVQEAEHALAAEREARSQAEQLAGELEQARLSAEQARRAAERSRAQAEAAGRAKSDFLATMSHELRTPINAITGYTQLIELGVAGPVTGAQREYLTRLQTSGEHLLVLINDVLDLAKIEAGRMTVARDLTSTDRAITSALSIIAPQAAARSIRVVSPGVNECLPYIGDEHRVRQILVNLLTNAVKFTPPAGTVTVECQVTHQAPRVTERSDDAEDTATTTDQRMTVVRVSDTGIGIDPAHQTRVFEPFVQVDGSRTRTVGGTGLGLAVSRRLARLMGGDLTLESAPGHGSTFVLMLPAPAVEHSTTDSITATSFNDNVAPATPQLPDNALPDAVTAATAARLGAVGSCLRDRLEELLDAYVAHLRADPLLESARQLSRVQLEDHALSFVADVVQSLLAIDESGGVESDLLRDGSAIQETIALKHGEQRHRLGWTEAQLVREYDILTTELDACARRTPAKHGDVSHALDIIHRFVDRACELSVRAHRHATRTNRGWEPGTTAPGNDATHADERPDPTSAPSPPPSPPESRP